MWTGMWFSEGGQHIESMQPLKVTSLSWSDIEQEVTALYKKVKLISKSTASERWILFEVKTAVPVKIKDEIIQQNRLVRLLVAEEASEQ